MEATEATIMDRKSYKKKLSGKSTDIECFDISEDRDEVC